MRSETYKKGDKVTWAGADWKIMGMDDEQVFIQSGVVTAFVFKSNNGLKLVKKPNKTL